jgi:hypothetical protein
VPGSVKTNPKPTQTRKRLPQSDVIAFVDPGTIFCAMSRLEKPPTDPELRRRIQELIASGGGGHNEENVADIIENALKLLKHVEHRGDVRVIQTALRELRYAFRLFAPYRRSA